MNQTEGFEAQNLTVGLYGTEDTYFRKRHRRGKSHYYKDHRGRQEIISQIFAIQDFPDGPPPLGQFTFPFALQIPDWVPASMMLSGEYENALLSIRYSIRAQMTPKNKGDWADAKIGLSSFRGTRMIYI